MDCKKCGSELDDFQDYCPACLADSYYSESKPRKPKNKRIKMDPYGVHKHAAQWLEAGTYRSLIHRHDGTFIAADESEGRFVHVDTLPLLSDALLNWPNGTEPLKPKDCKHLIGYWNGCDEGGLIEGTVKDVELYGPLAEEWFRFCPKCGQRIIVYWCNVHQREPSVLNYGGLPKCDFSLGGIAIPCQIVIALCETRTTR